MTILVILTACALFTFVIGRYRALQLAGHVGGIKHLHSLPNYYGWYAAWVTLLPSLFFLLLWVFSTPILLKSLTLAHFDNLYSIQETGVSVDLVYSQIVASLDREFRDLSYFDALASSARYYDSIATTGNAILYIGFVSLIFAGGFYGVTRTSATFKARNKVEVFVRLALLLCSSIAIITTLGIVISVLFESMRFFSQISLSEFLLGTHWSPQIAIRADQQGASGSFGAIPLFAGTLLITFIAMCIAAPIGIFSAIYLAEYAPARVRDLIKPIMEILAGIPTVVYGFFAALVIAPWIREVAESLGSESASSESALAAGLVMGVMIIPFVSSLSDDVIRSVPQDIRDASTAMGATKSETIKQVVLPAALPGIVGGFLLAVSRAIGETMIVVMAAGLTANLTVNPLESVTTITVQIVTLLVGDQEFDSVKTLSAFALGLTLFVITLLLNVIALQIVKKYREQYE